MEHSAFYFMRPPCSANPLSTMAGQSSTRTLLLKRTSCSVALWTTTLRTEAAEEESGQRDRRFWQETSEARSAHTVDCATTGA